MKNEFKRGIMRILIDEENCIEKLISLLNKTQLEAWEFEEKAKKLRKEENDIEELLIFLRSPMDK